MIQLQQKETTYEVEYNEETYSVVVLEDNVSLGYTQYDVFDYDGEVVKGDLETAIITYLEENV